jgi:hypothetical protein
MSRSAPQTNELRFAIIRPGILAAATLENLLHFGRRALKDSSTTGLHRVSPFIHLSSSVNAGDLS